METSTRKKRTIIQNSILENFFVEELKDIYGAEKQLQKNFNKLKDAAVSPRLKKAFGDHNQVTIEQISRLEDAFKLLGRRPQSIKCDAMEGLIEGANNVIDETSKDSATRDIGLILAAQKVEHYEIATYKCLTQLANTLGFNKISKLLSETLEEQKDTDELFSSIAKSEVNYHATIEK